jgi:ribulose 1,5-bisphosphate synthetase/thiazole synthase
MGVVVSGKISVSLDARLYLSLATFKPRRTENLSTAARTNDIMATLTTFTTVAIIGAGFSGLGTACQLKRRLNFDDFAIFERDSGLGGTWRANICLYIYSQI